MVPFAPLEDAEEPEPCHKMELYVSGSEVSVGPGGRGSPAAAGSPRAPACPGPGPRRPSGSCRPGGGGRADRNAPGRGLSPPAPAPPRLRASPPSLPRCPRFVRRPPPLSAPPLPRLPRDPPPTSGAGARPPPPGHLACSRLVPRSSRAGTGLPGSSPRLRPVPGRRRLSGATRSPRSPPPPREGPSPGASPAAPRPAPLPRSPPGGGRRAREATETALPSRVGAARQR